MRRVLALLFWGYVLGHVPPGHAQPAPPKAPQNLRVVTQKMTAAQERFFRFEALIAAKCLSCHRPAGSGADFTQYRSEYDWVNSSGLVIVGDFDTSPLNYYLRGGPLTTPPFGTMPPGIPFSAAEREVVRDWIDNLTPPPPPPTPTPPATLPPTATPTPSPTPSGTPVLLEPSDAAPPLAKGEFVKSLLDQIFGPSAAALTASDVTFYRSIFGGACDRMIDPPATGQNEDSCAGFDQSLYNATLVPKDSPRRHGRLRLACLKLVSRSATRDFAILRATGASSLGFLSSAPLPTAIHVISAYQMFYPGQPAPPASVVTTLLELAARARQANPMDNYVAWQAVLLTLCSDPFWQVP